MRKLGILLLAVLTILASLAFADGGQQNIRVPGVFTLQATVPEGYSFNVEKNEGTLVIAHLIPEDETRARFDLSLAYDEEYAGRSLNDLSDEEMEAIAQAGAATLSHPSIRYDETEHGTKLIITLDESTSNSALDIMTLYKGYMIEMVMLPSDESVLSEEQVDKAVEFLSNLWILPDESEIEDGDVVHITSAGDEDRFDSGFGGAIAGGWSINESIELTEDDLTRFDKAIDGLLGVDYIPEACLAHQLVSGMNYCYLCRATIVIPDAQPYFALVYIYEDLTGNASVLDIQVMDIGSLD